MSQRAKRPNRCEDGSVPVKRRKRTAAEEEEAATLAAWQPPRSTDLKSSSIYNRTTTEAPAELFRKDLISAMKLPDSEPLASNEYWVIVDQWKQEWERGVQVPVNPDSLPEPSVCVTHAASQRGQAEFKFPKNKYIRITKDDNFKLEEHVLSNAPAQSEAACGYDLDECDVAWLRLLNAERARCGQSPIQEEQLERVVEQLELTCWDKIQTILKNEEGLGIEYDENVICDVCRSPDSEEGNEMVFCDSCNICVHQACYGITRIPDGQWLCCTCNLGKRPKCVLCPNKGGAMKCTRSGQKWAHVSCALWIPEVSIGCVEKMEPITKISSIPQSRWALICVLCRERVGACIQCSVKTCKTAYHVTCAFKHGLEMRAIIEDENADDGVKLRSYCEKHSKSSKKEKSICSGSEDDDAKQRKKRKDMTSEEKNQARAARLQEIESEFHRHVAVKDVAMRLVDVDADSLRHIYNYWRLKRRAGRNKPLLPPKSEDCDVLSHKREQADLEKMKMFVQLRQDLERVRNLCYMVSRREKLSRSFFRLREQTFHKQATVLESSPNLAHNVVQAVIEANHGPSIYDRLYSRKEAPDHTGSEFDRILARIAGLKSPDGSGDERKLELNGLLKDKNPYKKVYFNGTSKRRSLYGSSSSSDERHVPPSTKPTPTTSSEDEVRHQDKKKCTTTSSPRKPANNNNNNQRKKRHSVVSSSEDDVMTNSSKGQRKKQQWGQYSRSRLVQVERELGYSGSDSDELMMPVKSEKKTDIKKMSSIYSDSDSSDVSATTKMNEMNKLRTKAAVKEFSHKPSTSKTSPTKKSGSKSAEVGKKNKKSDYVPSDLIVPQRQAAKKASENLKTTTTARSSGSATTIPASIKEEKSKEDEVKEKEKPKVGKVKGKEPPTKKDQKNTSDIFDLDKDLDKSESQEILAYVPQRQAAKKAAEHIKSGLGKPTAQTATTAEETSPKKDEVTSPSKITKKPPPAAPPPPSQSSSSQRKSSSNSSSSSTSSSSSDSSSSSGSESEDEQRQQEEQKKKKQQQQQQTTPQPRSESLFSNGEATAKGRTQNVKDWPFLDKAAKSSTGAARTPSAGGRGSSSDEQSSDDTSERSATSSAEKQRKQQQSSTPSKSGRSNRRQRSQQQPRKSGTTAASRGNRQNSTATSTTTTTSPSKSCDRLGDANVRTGDMSDSQRVDAKCVRKGKQHKDDDDQNECKKEVKPVSAARKQLQSPKEDKKLGDLEKEILERKAAVTSKTTRSTFDRLFGTSDKKTNLTKNKVKTKSTVKENKEPEVSSPKKSNVLSKTSDEVFVEKSVLSSGDTNKLEIKEKRDVIIEIADKTEDKPPPSRSIFSPPHIKDNLLDFDNLDDGFGIPKDEEIMKGPLTFNFGNSALFKEDSKEDSARETLNLVEKLRMELSKKSSSCDVDDVASSISSKTENEIKDVGEQVVPNSTHPSNDLKEEEEPVEPPHHHQQQQHQELQEQQQVNLEMRLEVSEMDARTTKSLFVENADSDRHYQQHHDFRYVNCEVDVPLEGGKNIPMQQHRGMPDRGLSTQGDERWVPPSDTYVDPHLQPPPYLQQYLHSHHPHLPPKLPEVLPPPPPSLELRLHETPTSTSPCSVAPPPSSSCSLRIPSCDATSMDCLPSPSPYTDLHPQAKWADSEIMPSRRSSSSSAASTSSSTRGGEDEEITSPQKMMMVNHQALDMAAYLPPPFAAAPPFVSEAAAQFVNPVSLFPPPPSLNVAMYPPPFGTPFPVPPPAQAAHVAPPPPTAVDPPPYPAQATFTSTQHNMELTAAMVNMTKEVVGLGEEREERQQEVVKEGVETKASVTPTVEASPKGKKSPSKPTRTSARVTSGKSPKQEIVIPTVKPARGRGGDSRRNSLKSISSSSTTSSSGRGQQSTGRRGRGRGRGRNAHHHHHHDYDSPLGNTIHNKLVGTVYDLDFDDDISSENVDLKSMRERRKSVEQQQKNNNELKEVLAPPPPASSSNSHEESISPKITPLPTIAHDDIRRTEVLTSQPQQVLQQHQVLEQPHVVGRGTKEDLEVHDERRMFPEMVQPVLPGPVDMRTYSGGFDQQGYSEQNLLRAFATGTTETQVNEEIDEEFEKELHTALTSTSTTTSASKKEQEPIAQETNNIKVSLSDSRNQLKVKIKGPIANYSATMPALPPPTSSVSNYAPNNVSNSVSSGAGGTSNLRRMRKKELLRQYWNQDANMDVESSCVPATPAAPPVSRTIITIPKAVASMTSIPTKDDYRDYRTGNDEFEVKNRKETKARPGALSRELRQLDMSLDVEGLGDRRRSLANSSHSSNVDGSLANKRRGRPPRPPSTPKIKIKIGNSSIVGRDDKRDRVRPPKKRLSTITMPSVEDLKRESMKYRKLVMADFGETKVKRKKKDKSEKRRKKKNRPPEMMQVIPNQTANPTKLIIRIGKKVEGERTSGGVDSGEPIKFKLTRCEGSGYVVKRAEPGQAPSLEVGKGGEGGMAQPQAPPPPPVPLNKDCEVR